MEMLVKMAEVLVKIAVMMMAPGGVLAPPEAREREPPFFLFFLHLLPSIFSGPLSRNPLYPLLEHGALCFILFSNDVLPSYDV